MSTAEFEPAIAASERPQIHSLDRAATVIGVLQSDRNKYNTSFNLLKTKLNLRDIRTQSAPRTKHFPPR
jgi:hypothetical protein